MEIPKIEISAEKIVDKVLDEIEFKGKSIREWAEYLIRNADDLISRQAAIDAVRELEKSANGWDYHTIDTDLLYDVLQEIPPIQPKQKTGQWIYKERNILINTGRVYSGEDGTAIQEKRWMKVKKPYCSECGWYENSEYEATPYCPNCGAKMESEEG